MVCGAVADEYMRSDSCSCKCFPSLYFGATLLPTMNCHHDARDQPSNDGSTDTLNMAVDNASSGAVVQACAETQSSARDGVVTTLVVKACELYFIVEGNRLCET